MEKKKVEGKETLPINAYRKHICEAVKSHRCTLIVAETGSGKTTQVPQFLFHAGLCGSKSIGITQPRRIAAITVARRVSEELNTSLGQLVGYSVRFDAMFGPMTKIKYLTDGMLLREAILSPTLDQYSIIILDEIHERSLHSDVLLGMLKKLLDKRQDLKVLAMSATPDTEKLAKFLPDCAVVEIPGRYHPVELFYLSQPEADYVEAASIAIIQLHLSLPPGDMLVFLPGQEEIDSLEEILWEKRKLLPHDKMDMEIVPLFSALPHDKQMKAFKSAGPDTRKIIICTNIAETSVTISGVKYVIDTGMCKMRRYLHSKGIEVLQETAISKASAIQRAGRAGREFPGQCYRLYPPTAYEKLFASTLPEILRVNLSSAILQLKTIGIQSLTDIEWVDPPKSEAIKSATYELESLGAIDMDGKITRLGRCMSLLPVDPIYSKLIITAITNREFQPVLSDIVAIVAMISCQHVFYSRTNRKNKGEKKIVENPISDHLTLLNAYNIAEKLKHKGDLPSFLNMRAIRSAHDIHKQIMDYCKDIFTKLSVKMTDKTQIERKDKPELIIKCLCKGLPLNLAQRIADQDRPEESKGVCYKAKRAGPCKIHPSSVLATKSIKPDMVVFTEMVLTKTVYMRYVTQINPAWISEGSI